MAVPLDIIYEFQDEMNIITELTRLTATLEADIQETQTIAEWAPTVARYQDNLCSARKRLQSLKLEVAQVLTIALASLNQRPAFGDNPGGCADLLGKISDATAIISDLERRLREPDLKIQLDATQRALKLAEEHNAALKAELSVKVELESTRESIRVRREREQDLRHMRLQQRMNKRYREAEEKLTAANFELQDEIISAEEKAEYWWYESFVQMESMDEAQNSGLNKRRRYTSL